MEEWVKVPYNNIYSVNKNGDVRNTYGCIKQEDLFGDSHLKINLYCYISDRQYTPAQ